MFEYFVYSSYVIGIHLRFSRVARGGIRNSDRIDDVRHEVFELAKTQRLKNTLIVPDGAKGGFVCKRLFGKKEVDARAEGLICYKIFIRSLLSLSDNYVEGKLTQPKSVVVYDDPDPYFVVAADKGTATFSSHANDISKEMNFWLDDAFASGGDNGYDHKKMGITAKGAWESVKWHFAHRNLNVYEDSFSVVGIGDMAGDVFGNGMLLSDKIRLVAAFGGDEIFIDPDPDPKKSYQERLRLFNLPRSRWCDYDETKISNGGGVFSRHDKYIELTPQIKKMLGIGKQKLEPNQLIRELLMMQVDLIWNGGIGVFVKAAHETNYDVMDFHNDACRVNASDMKASIFAEGGNNGLTQLGRVEFSERGGVLNTDFIDNSAGVNVSDVEVNLKIFFQKIVQSKRISFKQRNLLIEKLSHQVSDMVLHNNYMQNIQINLAQSESKMNVNQYARFMDVLESSGLLNRSLERLPSKKELLARKKQQHAFSRPELAVLLSYSKIYIHKHILDLNLLEAEELQPFLYACFPETLVKKYKDDISQHLLRRELIATQLTNTIVSEAGILYSSRMFDECSVDWSELLSAYVVVRHVLGVSDLAQVIYGGSKNFDQALQLTLLDSLRRAIYRSCRWFARNRDLDNIQKLMVDFSPVCQLQGVMLQYLPKKYVARAQRLEQQLTTAGVSKSIAVRLCAMRYAYQLMSIQSVIKTTNGDPEQVVGLYYEIANTIKFHKIRDRLAELEENSRWDAIQKSVIEDDLSSVLEQFTLLVFQHGNKSRHKIDFMLQGWVATYPQVYHQIRQVLSEMMELRRVDFSVFSVVITRMKSILDSLDSSKR